MNQDSKQIYIVLTYTGTFLSKIIKFYTHAEYAHVSLSLDYELNKMYSFGRKHPYNPFIGGFVHEKLNSGTFKRFKKTKALIYVLNLTDKQYEKIEEVIQKFERQRNIYKFNIIGLFGSAFNLKYRKKNTFYCAEFVKYLMDEANLNLDLPELVKPIDFKKIENLEIVFQGILKNYQVV